MGFFNKDDAQQQALAAQAAAMQQAAGMQGQMAGMGGMAMPDPAEMMAERDRIQRVNAQGVNGSGTVIAARNLGPTFGGVGTKMEIDVSVTAGPGAPRTITIKQDMVGDLAAYAPGAQLTIRINAQDPNEALVWSGAAGGAAPAPAAAAAPGGDMASRLQQLGQLRDSGALTPEEFEQQKARILAAG